MANASGFFAVEGLLAITTGSSTLTSGQNRLIGVELISDDFKKAYLEDGRSVVLGARANGRRRRARFTYIPYDSGGNAVTAKGNVKFPDPLAVVVISSSGLEIFDGSWNYSEPGSTAMDTAGFMQLQIICEQFYNPDTGLWYCLS